VKGLPTKPCAATWAIVPTAGISVPIRETSRVGPFDRR
jgi:hypothetical protein